MENQSELVKFNAPVEAVLIKRYKRFLADFKLPDGQIVTAHCTNTGSMRSVCQPGQSAILSRSQNPDRKLKFTWEAIQIGKPDHWVGVNTANPNRLVFQALQKNLFSNLISNSDDFIIEPEKKINSETRLDFCLTPKNSKSSSKIFIEVKNVTLLESNATTAYFPDSVSLRAKKHLETLAKLSQEGHRAIVLFVVQRTDALYVGPAVHIDLEYSKVFDLVTQGGVSAFAYSFHVTEKSIVYDKNIPVLNSKGESIEF